MASIYGHRWTSSYGDDPAGMAGDTWASGLAGLTGAQLAHGLQACLASSEPWPPTLPEFRSMCLGIPPMAAVRLDAGKQGGFTRLVWQFLDGHRYRSVSADQADRLLREAYELAREHVMRGGELPEVAGAVEQEKREVKPADPEVAKAHVEAIRRELCGKDLAAGPDR
nr:hypothetical protein [Lysobacter sp. GX 14042]